MPIQKKIDLLYLLVLTPKQQVYIGDSQYNTVCICPVGSSDVRIHC